MPSSPPTTSLRPVFPGKPERPYFENWLRRTRKQLSASGRLTEISIILSREEGNTAEHWSRYLRSVIDGESTPSVDLLTKIDALLAKPLPAADKIDPPPML